MLCREFSHTLPTVCWETQPALDIPDALNSINVLDDSVDRNTEHKAAEDQTIPDIFGDEIDLLSALTDIDGGSGSIFTDPLLNSSASLLNSLEEGAVCPDFP